MLGFFLIINFDNVDLKSDLYTFEYGEVIIFDKENLLDTSNPKILDSLIIDLSNIEFEDNKKFPKVGVFKASVSYIELFRTKKKTFSIVVSDTIKPNFSKFPKEIKIITTDDNYDLLSYFVVDDLSEFEIKIDTSSVNFKKEGQYDAKATATDIYGNEASKNFSILIEKEIAELPEVEEDELENNKPDTPLEGEAIPPAEKPLMPEDKPEESEEEIVPTFIKGILIVNKKHPLPASYSPGDDPTALAQLKIMIKDMQDLNFDISDSYSGFRTYSYQKNLYERYVSMDGKAAAETYSARPGHSEHQTGLTYDLKHSNGTLVEKALEAKWISENASNYGFIVRYKSGREHITGYQAEPWHLRYIGNEATAIYNSDLTLEEYLGVEGGDYYDN